MPIQTKLARQQRSDLRYVLALLPVLLLHHLHHAFTGAERTGATTSSKRHVTKLRTDAALPHRRVSVTARRENLVEKSTAPDIRNALRNLQPLLSTRSADKTRGQNKPKWSDATNGVHPSFGRNTSKQHTHTIEIWLILPVVICLFQGLSHACLRITALQESAHGSLHQT
jgi:hypothetical protein